MSKIAIIYFSGTGNTEAMAKSIEKGAKAAGADVQVIECDGFTSAQTAQYDAFAFGCPSYGSEELEESSFAPMWDEVKGELGDKKVVLFGSYGWGNGEWMESWKEDAENVNVIDTYICNETPNEDDCKTCEELGAKLAK